MKLLKIIGKIVCMPIMIIVKVFLLLISVVLMFVLFTLNACSKIAGTIVNLIMLLIGIMEIVGIGMTIYQGEWEACLALVIILIISAVIAFIPVIAQLIIELLSELNDGLMEKALEVPVILNF